MFDNPEKLIILLVIALLIFGPSKLAGFGGTLGRTIRDFRNAVQGARDEARETFGAFTQEASAAATEIRQALPGPDAGEMPAAETYAPGETASSEPAMAAAGTAGDGPWDAQTEPAGGTAAGVEAGPAAVRAADHEEDLGSLASEPTAEALREDAQPAGHARS